MADVFSTVAAAVGLADVVLRLGRETINLISTIRHSSDEIRAINQKIEDFVYDIIPQVQLLSELYRGS